MASPQLKDGYMSIANEIMEALAQIRIPGEARQILDVILRKTYGWKKKEDEISLSQFKERTGLLSPNIIRAKNKLLKMNIITVIQKDNSDIPTYRFQKDYTKWRSLSKKIMLSKRIIGVIQKDNLPLSKRIDTKETNIKETITKTSKPLRRGKKISEPKIYFDFEKRKFINIKQRDLDEWKDAFPAVDIEQKIKALGQWLLNNPSKQKKNYRRFLTNNISRDQDKGGSKLSYDDQRKKKLDDWTKKPLEK